MRALTPLLGAALASALAPRNDHHHHTTTTATGIAAPTAIWVAADIDGVPTRTYTPSYITDAATSSLADAPPYVLTGTVFTEYHPDRTVFGTRLPQPTTSGAGAFPLCTAAAAATRPANGTKGENPFCYPRAESTLFVDSTYYFTWNPHAFNETKLIFHNVTTNSTLSNSTLALNATAVALNSTATALNSTALNTTTTAHRTVRLRGVRVNQTTPDDDIFETAELPGTAGMAMIKVTSKFLRYKYPAKLRLTLVSTLDGATEEYTGPLVAVQYRPEHERETHIPQGAELYIALPIVFGFIILMSGGLLYYHRRTRFIGIGSIMGKKGAKKRSRTGYQKVSGDDHDDDADGDDIPLTEGGRRSARRARMPDPFDDYPSHVRTTMGAYVRNSHRVSADLGSLASTPTTPRFGSRMDKRRD